MFQDALGRTEWVCDKAGASTGMAPGEEHSAGLMLVAVSQLPACSQAPC